MLAERLVCFFLVWLTLVDMMYCLAIRPVTPRLPDASLKLLYVSFPFGTM